MAESKKIELETLCRYCRRTEVKSVKYEKCESTYHPSCITRLKGVKSNSESNLICCESSKDNDEVLKYCVNNDVYNIQTEAKNTITTESSKIDLMIEIIQELEHRNQVLIENNQLLKFKISVLERNVCEGIPESEGRQNHSEKTYEQMEYAITGNDVNVNDQPNRIRNPLGNTETDDPKRTRNKEINDEASNFTNKIIKPTIVENEGKWNTIQRRNPRKLQQTLLGTCKVTNRDKNFSVQEKEAWFFISRVKEHVTENSIENYIKHKPGFEKVSVEVKELLFEEKKGKLKSFLVKVPFERKDELYIPSFWPENVGIGRFNLQLYKNKCPNNTFLYITNSKTIFAHKTE
ncbi:hypothetical protein WA026_017699 [Henosepilachna vigintioctopunctata]|uniref:Uncharacterized protein n=1 Tax=Henosepilachna vigintioctopunctata TaxID=420089 RepID=A0AAW1UAL6_9CUCU